MPGTWKKADGVVWEEFESDALLIAPSGTSWSLNALAAAIWKCCDGSLGSDELGAALSRARGVSMALARTEVSAFCETLERAGLLRLVTGGAGVSETKACFAGMSGIPAISGPMGAGRRAPGRPSPRGVSGPV